MAKSKTITPEAATEQTVTRRRMLLGLGAATASVAVIATPSAIKAETLARTENPKLLGAHEKLKDARKELEQAKESLEWLADEWRHLWPVAPEEILGYAHADRYGRDKDAERDIIGRYIRRDTSGLAKQFPPKWRQENPSVCFSVYTPEEASERLESWKRHKPKGRTEKSLAQNKATREQFIADSEEKLILALRYRVETDTVRKAARVQEAKNRIETAKQNVQKASRAISFIEAFTTQGLCIKADGLMDSPLLRLDCMDGGPGELGRFVEAVCLMHMKENP